MAAPTFPEVTWELSDRSRQILFAVVTEYITSGKPVSSTTIARRYGVALSPATIRNVLADLVDAGFVHQPHTSAGRVPTDVGFRAGHLAGASGGGAIKASGPGTPR